MRSALRERRQGRRVWRWLGGVVHGLVAGLFGLAYAARYVHPEAFWWGGLLAPGLALLAGGVLGALVLALAGRRWRWAALHAGLLGLAAVRLWPALPPAAAQGESASLTVLTYNISAARLERQQGRALLAFVREHMPDLLVLQEAYLYYRDDVPVRPSRYLQLLIDSLGYRTLRPAVPLRDHTEQAVLARPGVHLLAVEQHLLSVGPDDRRASEVVRVRFRWEGREAVLYNLHLRSFGRLKPWEDQRHWLNPAYWRAFLGRYREAFGARAREAEQLRALIEQDSLPVIVAGDFNSTPHNWSYHHLARGLQDAFRVAGSGWGGTYHVRFPVVHIDHVLAGPAWAVESAVIPDLALSDHRPLVVRLRWAAE
ncbi:hypothetical protein AWN76_016205 [Rhodothermaceae bacterium RA]|nr:hypothetical protein AWN76_016205 [Rhodothermaceae bacterium RA]